MSTINNGSNLLAVVGGAALTVGMVGVHLAQALMPQAQAMTPHQPPLYRHSVVAPTQVPLVTHPAATAFVPATAVVPKSGGDGSKKDIPQTQPPSTPIAPPPPQVPSTPIVPSSAPVQGLVVNGDQATYTNQTPPFRITYPADWTASSTSNTYNVVSADTNSGVGVYLETSAAVDLPALQSALVGKLPMFLQQYGGSETGTPQYQQASVDGIPAVVSSFPVDKNGQSGVASVSATYYNGVIYYVWGLIADQSAAGATQETAQVSSIMNSFHLL